MKLQLDGQYLREFIKGAEKTAEAKGDDACVFLQGPAGQSVLITFPISVHLHEAQFDPVFVTQEIPCWALEEAFNITFKFQALAQALEQVPDEGLVEISIQNELLGPVNGNFIVIGTSAIPFEQASQKLPRYSELSTYDSVYERVYDDTWVSFNLGNGTMLIPMNHEDLDSYLKLRRFFQPEFQPKETDMEQPDIPPIDDDDNGEEEFTLPERPESSPVQEPEIPVENTAEEPAAAEEQPAEAPPAAEPLSNKPLGSLKIIDDLKHQLVGLRKGLSRLQTDLELLEAHLVQEADVSININELLDQVRALKEKMNL